LGKDTPIGRHIERSGTIVTTPILSGLHHRYARIWFSGRTGPRGSCVEGHRRQEAHLSNASYL